MDDLDRLAFRLVRTVRNSYPHLLEQGFTLTDLEERLVPYRETRRELADSAPHAWEIMMLRLMTGERGYLTTEPGLQDACRQALDLTSPSVSLVRSWCSSAVSLGTSAIQLGTERAVPAANDFDATAIGLAFSSGAMPLTTPMTTSRNSNSLSTRTTRSDEHASVSHDSGSSSSTGSSAASASGSAGSTSVSSRSNAAQTSTCSCRSCGGRLPDSTKFTFCPHCGVNLTVRQCPACSTELDITWRFCVTCGRGADLPEIPDVPPRDGQQKVHHVRDTHIRAVS